MAALYDDATNIAHDLTPCPRRSLAARAFAQHIADERHLMPSLLVSKRVLFISGAPAVEAPISRRQRCLS